MFEFHHIQQKKNGKETIDTEENYDWSRQENKNKIKIKKWRLFFFKKKKHYIEHSQLGTKYIVKQNNKEYKRIANNRKISIQ